MGIKKLTLVAISLAVIGCSSKVKDNLRENYAINSNFFVTSPINLDHEYIREDQSVAYSNFKAPKLKLENGDVVMEIFSKNKCPLLGSSKTQNVNLGQWGRVDFWENRYDGMDIQDEYPFCRPPSKGVAYAFCAEKDGKAVAICIQQMTDDEDQAREIFESFRWTD